MYEVKLADGTTMKNLRMNGNNFVSDVPIEDGVFEGNLSKVTIISEEGVEKYTSMKLLQNKQYGDEYWFVLAEKTSQELEREELLQLMADLAELTLEAIDNG